MNTIDNLAINSIRILSADAIQKANSGHPGLPLGSAPMAYELWAHHMNHNPANPESCDHGSDCAAPDPQLRKTDFSEDHAVPGVLSHRWIQEYP